MANFYSQKLKPLFCDNLISKEYYFLLNKEYRMSILSNVESSSGYIYYDLQIKNLANDRTPDNVTQLTFEETRTAPIINKADDYDMSIIRFQCDTYSLPVYQAEILPNAGQNDLMIHNITLNYTNGSTVTKDSFTRFLIWEPADLTVPAPVPPSQTQSGFQVQTPWYHAYDYDHILRIVNTAFEAVMQDLRDWSVNVANPNLGDFVDLTNIEAPLLVWNDSENKATLYARADYFNVAAPPPTILNPLIEIYFSQTLYAMFNSFPIKKVLNSAFSASLPVGTTPFYQIMVDNFKGGKTVQGLFGEATERFISVPQQYSTISEWSPVSSVVFTSSTLPIVVNQLSNPVLYLNNNLIQLARPSNNFNTLITDLVTDEQSYRGSLLFIPSAEYRWISLTTSRPINQIDIQVYWRSKIGSLIPFTLPSGGSCSLKILFRKKQY